jgi:hypothetical protein
MRARRPRTVALCSYRCTRGLGRRRDQPRHRGIFSVPLALGLVKVYVPTMVGASPRIEVVLYVAKREGAIDVVFGSMAQGKCLLRFLRYEASNNYLGIIGYRAPHQNFHLPFETASYYFTVGTNVLGCK